MEENRINALVFDWGNTIMVDEPGSSGKMKDREQVRAVSTARETLATLAQTYPLYLASNAMDSNSFEISEALKRVDLDHYFKRIFTGRDFDAPKSEPVFYQRLTKWIGFPAETIVMIGDNFQQDVLSPSASGLKTVWFNPSKNTAPALLPIQDMEIRVLVELIEVLEKTFLPDPATCMSWYLERHASHALLAHVQNVAAIAYQIAIWVDQSCAQCSPLLAHRGALVHDIAKLEEGQGKNHAQLAAEFLISQNQPELAEIARRHLISDMENGENDPVTWEEKIVNYADKLSEGSQLVSLDERLAYIKERYPAFSDKILRNTPKIKKLESEILDCLQLTENQFHTLLKAALFNKSV